MVVSAIILITSASEIPPWFSLPSFHPDVIVHVHSFWSVDHKEKRSGASLLYIVKVGESLSRRRRGEGVGRAGWHQIPQRPFPHQLHDITKRRGAAIGQPRHPGKQLEIHYAACVYVCVRARMCMHLWVLVSGCWDLCAVMSPQAMWTYRLYTYEPSLSHAHSLHRSRSLSSPTAFICVMM